MKTRNPLAWRKLGLMTVAMATFGLMTACNNDKSATLSSPTSIADTSCLWRGPISTSNPAANTAYPDAGANYWSGIVTIPTGARLFLKGQYPHARYISYISYRDDGTPLESLADTAIMPDPGSTNPFVSGNLRTLDKRDYQIEIVPGAPPDAASRPANTLYAPVDAGKTVTLLYRIYVPDHDTGLTGGVKLPEVELKLADGREIACAAVVLTTGTFQHLAIADPAAAPYGRAAMEVLAGRRLDGRLKPRLVSGNSIAQTFQFVRTGSAELGFIALAQAITLKGGSRWLVPAADHRPIEQQAILLTAATDPNAAAAFLKFLRSPEARALIRSQGYEVH